MFILVISIWFYVALLVFISFHVHVSCLLYQIWGPLGQEPGPCSQSRSP